MYRSSKPPPPPPQKGGNIVGIVVALLATALTITFVSNDLPQVINLGRIPWTWKSVLQRVIPCLAISVVFSYGGYILARASQWKFIAWLDNRLLPVILKKNTKVAKKAPSISWWKGNPDLRLAPAEIQEQRYGTFTTQLGERVIGGIFFPNWEARTGWPYLGEMVSNIAITSLLATTLLVIFNISIYSLAAILGIFLSASLWGILRYWSREWERYAEFFIITTHRYILTQGRFSWFGFLFKRGFDIEIRYTQIVNVTDVDQSPLPKAFGISINPLLEAFLEHWSQGPSAVGTIAIRSNAIAGAELLLHYSFAPSIYSLIQQAKVQNRNIQGSVARLEREADNHVLGRPGEIGATAQKKRDVERWLAASVEQEGLMPSGEFDIFRYRIEQLGSLGYPTTSNQNSKPTIKPKAPSIGNVSPHFASPSGLPFSIEWEKTSEQERGLLYSTGFTEEELEELHSAGLHVQEILRAVHSGMGKNEILRKGV